MSSEASAEARRIDAVQTENYHKFLKNEAERDRALREAREAAKADIQPMVQPTAQAAPVAAPATMPVTAPMAPMAAPAAPTVAPQPFYGGDGAWHNPVPPTPAGRSITLPIIANGIAPATSQYFLDNAIAVSNPSSIDFVDAYGRGVNIPFMPNTTTPCLDIQYARAWWELKQGDILLGDDGKTLFRRNFDDDEGHLLSTFHRFQRVEIEFEVPSNRWIKGMTREFVAVLRRLSDRPRVHRGIKFGSSLAFVREPSPDGGDHTVVRRIDANDARLREPFEIQFATEWDDALASQGREWLAWMTNDSHSTDNLARLFATPVLEPNKQLTYIGYGRGRNGKGTIWEYMERDEAVADFTTTFSTNVLFPSGSPSTIQEQAPLALQGKLWACDTDADVLKPGQVTMLKKFSTGDPTPARQIGQSSVTVRNQATLVIFTNRTVALPDTDALGRRRCDIRFKDGHSAAEFLPLRAFLDQHGVAPFFMASCLLWETGGDEQWMDVSITDSIGMSDYELALADAIVAKGYATTSELPRASKADVEASQTRMGVVSKRVRLADGSRPRVLAVGNEARFKAFREKVEGDVKAADETPLSVDSPAATAVRKTYSEMAEAGLWDGDDGVLNNRSLVAVLANTSGVDDAETALNELVAAHVLASEDDGYRLVG